MSVFASEANSLGNAFLCFCYPKLEKRNNTFILSPNLPFILSTVKFMYESN
jgi:hypothetical protein